MIEPLVSVVIPCYNAVKTLEKTIASVLLEKYASYEIIIVDDGSTDGSSDIIRKYEDFDKRIRGFRTKNGGVSSARNLGVRLAATNYIAFLDADDLFLGNSLSERMTELLTRDTPDLLGVFCPAVWVNLQGEALVQQKFFDYHFRDDRLYFLSTAESSFNPSSVIVKKKEFLKVGGFDETLKNGEDYELWHRMLRRGGYFKQVNTCNVAWVQHADSVVHSNLIAHYQGVNSVSEKLFSPTDDPCLPEYQEGWGKSIHQLNLTKRAFGFAIRAIVTEQTESAGLISEDIRKSFLDQTPPIQLANSIKVNILRALGKSSTEWPVVWAGTKKLVINYLEGLNRRLGKDSETLAQLINHLSSSDGGLGAFEAIAYNSFTNQNDKEISDSMTLVIPGSRKEIEWRYQRLLAQENRTKAEFSEQLLILRQGIFYGQNSLTMVDVGAQAGDFFRPFAERGWQVIAFEAAPTTFKELNQKYKSWPGVTCLPTAVSNTTGETVQLYVGPEHWGIRSLKPFHPTHSQVVMVQTTRLDDALVSLKVNKVSFLRIDIEGADFLAIQGFDFQRYQPDFVMCEFKDNRSVKNFGYTHHDVAAYMEKYGYKTYIAEWSPIIEYGRRGVATQDAPHFIQCVPYPLDHEAAWGNLIFVPKEGVPLFEQGLIEYVKEIGHVDPHPSIIRAGE